MKKLLLLLVGCFVLLAACGQKNGQEEALPEENVEQTGENHEEHLEGHEEDLVLEPTEEINQLGNDGFTEKMDNLPTNFIMEKDGEYTYLMFERGDYFLSILKGDEWIQKDIPLPINDWEALSNVQMYGKQLIAKKAPEEPNVLFTYDENGEVTEEVLTDLESYAKPILVRTSAGTTLGFDGQDLYYDKEDGAFKGNKRFHDYIDLKDNISYYMSDDGVTAYDLEAQEVIYDEETGQETLWKLDRNRLILVGQDKHENFYVQELINGEISVSLYDSEFNHLNTYKTAPLGRVNQAHMIEDTLYIYEPIEFKGKTSLRVLTFN